MKKRLYQITGRSTDYYVLEVMAESADDAYDIAREMDGSEWLLVESGKIEVESVELQA